MRDTSKSIGSELSDRDSDALITDENPLISVIVPTHNRPDFLDRSLRSICAQSYSNVEIVVVNDAGCPTEEIIRKHNTKGNIHYLSHGSNKGASAARNSGLRIANGRYIAYLDDDDEYLTEHLSTIIAALRDSTHRFAYSRTEYLIETEQNGQLVIQRQLPFASIEYSRDLLMLGNFIPTPSWVFERSLLDEVGAFDESFSAWEDWEWLIRASEKTGFLSIPIVTVTVHQRANDTDHLGVKHRPEMRKWFEKVYAKHPAPTPELASAREEHLKFLFPSDVATELQSHNTPSNKDADLEASAFAAALQGSLNIIDLINSAEHLGDAQRLDLAAELYRQWLNYTQSPLKYAIAFNLGTVLVKAELFPEAEQAFRRSLAYSTKFAPARFGLAGLLERRGHIEEALAHWRWICKERNDVMNSNPDLYERALDNLRKLQGL